MWVLLDVPWLLCSGSVPGKMAKYSSTSVVCYLGDVIKRVLPGDQSLILWRVSGHISASLPSPNAPFHVKQLFVTSFASSTRLGDAFLNATEQNTILKYRNIHIPHLPDIKLLTFLLCLRLSYANVWNSCFDSTGRSAGFVCIINNNDSLFLIQTFSYRYKSKSNKTYKIRYIKERYLKPLLS